jgi:hypothetical protein
MSAVEGTAKSWKRALDDAYKNMTNPDIFGIRQMRNRRLSANHFPSTGEQELPCYLDNGTLLIIHISLSAMVTRFPGCVWFQTC